MAKRINPQTALNPYRVTVSAFFPELKGGKSSVEAEGYGASIKSAVSAATRALLKSRKLKAQRYMTFKAEFVIIKPRKEADIETSPEGSTTVPLEQA